MTDEEMMAALDNMPIVFGLRAQGHIPTIERMLAENKTWDEIGNKIGWCPKTAREHYERYLGKPMKMDDVQRNTIYETRMSRGVAPLHVVDVIPTGVICTNLNTKREVFIKKEQLHRMGKIITSMSEWRLHNGEASV